MAQSYKFAASVIIPTYNRKDILESSLRSLRASNMPKDAFEIIVVDDGSSDDSFEVVRAFTDSCQIRYVYQEDKGFRLSRARNQGIALAEGEVCIFIDCGIIVSNGFVQAHVDAHRIPNRQVIGYLYGFSNTNDYAEELERVLEAELDLDHVDKLIAKFRANKQFPDLRENIYGVHGDTLMKLPVPWSIA